VVLLNRSPTPGRTRKGCSGRGGKPQKGRRLREEETPGPSVIETPKSPAARRRGTGGGAGEKPPWRASASGAQAGPAPRARRALKGRTSGGHRPPADFGSRRYGCVAGVKLWSRSSFFALRGAAGRGRRQESTGPGRGADRRAEQGPEDENPRSVTGAKQTRAVSRGVSRRGRAKRRGRRAAGLEARRVDPRLLMRCRGRKPRRVPSGARRRRRSSGVPWRGA
jgi:hypothetical protein